MQVGGEGETKNFGVAGNITASGTIIGNGGRAALYRQDWNGNYVTTSGGAYTTTSCNCYSCYCGSYGCSTCCDYYSCQGACNQSSPVNGCTPTFLGYLH